MCYSSFQPVSPAAGYWPPKHLYHVRLWFKFFPGILSISSAQCVILRTGFLKNVFGHHSWLVIAFTPAAIITSTQVPCRNSLKVNNTAFEVLKFCRGVYLIWRAPGPFVQLDSMPSSLVSVHVSAPFIIFGKTHWLKRRVIRHWDIFLDGRMSKILRIQNQQNQTTPVIKLQELI